MPDFVDGYFHGCDAVYGWNAAINACGMVRGLLSISLRACTLLCILQQVNYYLRDFPTSDFVKNWTDIIECRKGLRL